jgi:hypothetical protein
VVTICRSMSHLMNQRPFQGRTIRVSKIDSALLEPDQPTTN